MSKSLSLLYGVMQYEFRMQITRPMMWIVFLFFGYLFYGIVMNSVARVGNDIISMLAHGPVLTTVAQWTLQVNTYLPICVGILLADRLLRDRNLKVDELLRAIDLPLGIRLLGKYIGTLGATLLPLFVFYSFGIGYILFLTKNPLVLAYAVETFLVIILPGMLFISAFSLALPMIIRVPLYQFGFVGYWLWGNALWNRPYIPSISRTILTPIGIYAAGGCYGVPLKYVQATPELAITSILLLIGISVLVMCSLWRYMRWQQKW